MRILLFFIFLSCLFSLQLCSAELPVMKGYSKNSAVNVDGALLEGVWQIIPPEYRFLKENGERPRFLTKVKCVYETEYLCFGMECETPLRCDARKIEESDSLRIELFPEEGGNPLFMYELRSLNGECSPVMQKIRTAPGRYFAEVKFPIPGENMFYCHGGKYRLKMTRIVCRGKKNEEKSIFDGILSLDGAADTDNTPRPLTKKWHNGDFNTLFKRPSRRWNANWDLGEGEWLEQSWILNRAKEMGVFEVRSHKDKKDDYYAVLKNGDFYQIYRGQENLLHYEFMVKGKGLLRVRFLRFRELRDHSLRLIGELPERKIVIHSDQWKKYSGIVKKVRDGESLALDFCTENFGNAADTEILIDDAYMSAVPEP